MGGFCGISSKTDCVSDLFFGTDYHSHLGTHRGGMAVLGEDGFQRAIHNIQNAPFRSKFEADAARFSGRVGIGVISDTDPQPLVMCARLGMFAIVTVGLVTNIEELKRELFTKNSSQLQFSTTSGMVGPTEVISAMIASQDSIVEGIRYVQSRISGSCSMLVVSEDGRLYAARDRYGRTHLHRLVEGRGVEQAIEKADQRAVCRAVIHRGCYHEPVGSLELFRELVHDIIVERALAQFRTCSARDTSAHDLRPHLHDLAADALPFQYACHLVERDAGVSILTRAAANHKHLHE